MWLEMWAEMMGSWVGVASLAVILLSALAIPAGIVWALMAGFKGPVERAHEHDHDAPARPVPGPRRYAH